MRLAVLGSPIAHSKSPLLHAAAYRQLGLDWSYEAIEMVGDDLVGFLDTYKAPPLSLYAIYPPTRHLAVKVRLFIDFLVARFGTRNAW